MIMILAFAFPEIPCHYVSRPGEYTPGDSVQLLNIDKWLGGRCVFVGLAVGIDGLVVMA